MSTQDNNRRSALSGFLNGGGRIFRSEEPTPCQGDRSHLWFSPFRDRIHAVRACQSCPFRGRCSFNAVATRATHGVWGGIALPGDWPELLEPIYRQLMEQFEARRECEIGGRAVVLPSVVARRRHDGPPDNRNITGAPACRRPAI